LKTDITKKGDNAPVSGSLYQRQDRRSWKGPNKEYSERKLCKGEPRTPGCSEAAEEASLKA